MDEEIRHRIEARIAQQHPGRRVCVRSAQRIEGRGIQIRDLSITEPGAAGAELLRVEEVLVECSTEWQQLLTESAAPRRVTLRRPWLRLVRRQDGEWNAAELFRSCHAAAAPPCVVENGTVEIWDPARRPTGRWCCAT